MTRPPLAGKGVAITRPANQARGLAERVEQAGGRPIPFPTIEVRELEDLSVFHSVLERLDAFDFALFVSPNAVERALAAIRARRELPAKLRLFAVGAGTARALARHGLPAAMPHGGRYDSEALLELPELAQPGGRRIVIFRGDGGRELLGATLRARGALVEYAECYRRARPPGDAAPLIEHARRGELHAITVTSSEGLRNLAAMLGEAGRDVLRETPLFVPHPRIGEAAQALDVRTVVVTGPGDAGLAAGLTAYFEARAARAP